MLQTPVLTPEDLIANLIRLYPFLPDTYKRKIKDITNSSNFRTEDYSPSRPPSVGTEASDAEEIDLLVELNEQMKLARTVRKKLEEPNSEGEPISARECAQVMTSITNFLSFVHKITKEIKTMRRIQVIERATIDVLKEVSPELKEKFLELLKQRLVDMNG